MFLSDIVDLSFYVVFDNNPYISNKLTVPPLTTTPKESYNKEIKRLPICDNFILEVIIYPHGQPVIYY